MIPEIGHFALILAFCLALLQCVLPLISVAGIKHFSFKSGLQVAYPLAIGQSFFITFSFLCLIYAFVQDDFSVSYVALHSNTRLPMFYKISALWGGHEGSLLLWLFILNLWTLALGIFTRAKALQSSTSLRFFAIVLAVLGIISLGFLLLLLLSSNPFARFLPDYPIDGNDLNPVLQDIGLIIHPPLLYMGYVGFAVPFAFAISAIVLNLFQSHFASYKIDIKDLQVNDKENMHLPWAKWLRPWCLTAFSFLTLGVMLGSWWAYYELGWGGWWFWDPVENASFIPWLVGLALIHVLMTTDKQAQFQSLTLLLCILVFAFSLLGTFLVRSGVLSSVHSFANDPKRGILILIFLTLVVGAGLTLYAIWARNKLQKISGAATSGKSDTSSQKTTNNTIELYSREMFILISAWCLLVAALSVLLGTLYPLLYEILTKQKISVGFPYFNAVFIPLMIPVLIFTPLGPLTKWGRNSVKDIFKKIRLSLAASIILALLLPWIIFKTLTLTPGFLTSIEPYHLPNNSLWVMLGLSLGFWIIFGTLLSLATKIKKKGSLKGLSWGAWGMVFAHIGMGVTVIGITLVSQYHIERTVRILPGQSLDIAGYQVLFQKIDSIEGANFIGYRGHFKVSPLQQKSNSIDLYPEKRIYVIQGSALSETAIDPGFFRDIYIALGEKLPKGAWSARIYYKPFVRWIWLGAIMIAMGGLMAAWGRRTFK